MSLYETGRRCIPPLRTHPYAPTPPPPITLTNPTRGNLPLHLGEPASCTPMQSGTGRHATPHRDEVAPGRVGQG